MTQRFDNSERKRRSVDIQVTIDTIPTGHAGESPGGFGAEGVCCESRIRVRESGKERDHIQGKLKGDSYTATTELWPQLSTETLLLTFPDDATVNQFSAAVTKIKENKERRRPPPRTGSSRGCPSP